MMFSDKYRVITQKAEHVLKVKGSRFLSFAYPVNTEAEIKSHLTALKLRFPDANHHCYAWILGADKQNFRSNDDGEPSGSAGKPLLRSLQKSELCNVLIVVVRYFGGTLLGVPGLIQAYSESATACLHLCPIEEKSLKEKYILKCPFGSENEIFIINKQFKAELHVKKDAKCFSAEIKIPLHQVEAFKQQISSFYQLTIEYAGVE